MLVAPQAIKIRSPPIEGSRQGMGFQSLVGPQLAGMLLQPGHGQQRLKGIGQSETQLGLG